VADVRGVSFDLYGTLWLYGDMRAAWRDWLQALHGGLAERGLVLGVAELAERCLGFFELPVPPDEGDGLSWFEARVRRLARELTLAPSLEQVVQIAEASVSAWQRHVPLDEDAPAVVHELARRVPLALVSNFDQPRHVLALLEGARLTDAFRVRVISAEVGMVKPDPGIFSIALQALGLPAGEVLHVGDTSEDVDGALAAGMQPVLIRRGEGTLRRVLDYTVRDGELPTDGDDGPPDAPGVRVISSLRELLHLVPPP
jgi:HAD superfamily hydrolase (TIGR01549 family)